MLTFGVIVFIATVALCARVWCIPAAGEERNNMAELRFLWWYLRWSVSFDLEMYREVGCTRIRALYLSLVHIPREIPNGRQIYQYQQARTWCIDADGVYTESGK